jgi:hypothetical protein
LFRNGIRNFIIAHGRNIEILKGRNNYKMNAPVNKFKCLGIFKVPLPEGTQKIHHLTG